MRPYFANRQCSAASAVAKTAVSPMTTTLLKRHDGAEVLRFLQERALHNVVMSGFIRDHGIESELNRGSFYGSRDDNNRLQGVALIGHATFMDARREIVIPEFARLAQDFPRIHLVLSELELVEHFWRSYAPAGQKLRRRSREIMFELNHVHADSEHTWELQPATPAELHQVAALQAALAFRESGVSPLQKDRAGFLFRCQQRIERHRVWTLIQDSEIIFKADIISETPEVTYLEGIYVDPNHRNKGLGSRCLTQLAHRLLNQTRSVVILVNENRTNAQRFFQRVGFVARSVYDTLFLAPAHAGEDQMTPRQLENWRTL
jgi:ribosomal protein S18 acetylase RimI-like enzyme